MSFGQKVWKLQRKCTPIKIRVISMMVALALTAGVLPVSALAADSNWAGDAVKTLNGIYGSGIFSADNTAVMTEKETADILKQMGCTTEVLLDDGTTGVQLTRETACNILADVFRLSLGGQSALEYLYDKNIINGTANGLDEDGKVSAAEFAVLTYRVLNAVGGGMGSDSGLTPGTDEYFAWLYLAARNCVPFDVYPNAAETKIKDVTMYTMVLDTNYDWRREEKTGHELWDAWVVELRDKIASGTFEAEYPGDSATLLDAVVKIVNEYIAAGGCTTIFADIPTASEFYDGVMYLFDHNIVTGEGDGNFLVPSASNDMTRNDFAVLLYRNAGKPEAVGNSEIEKAQAYVTAPEQNYMTPVSDDLAWWGAVITKEEAIMAVMKACVNDVDLSKANAAVLDRFSDIGQVSEAAKPYISYAVSIGLINGTTGATINPFGTVKPDTAGVLLYRTLLGVDKSKMKDYTDNVEYALNNETNAILSLPDNGTEIAAEATAIKILTLREDWRLTDDLDLHVPEGITLIVDGKGHHIYEMGGTLQNSGKGTVTFADDTILYPMNGATGGGVVNGSWDTEESNALMDARKIIEYTITISPVTGGTIIADKQKAQPGETVKLSVTPDDDYELKAVLVNDGLVALNDNQFIMPDGNVIVTATFAEIPPIDDDENDNEGTIGDTGGSTEDSELPNDDTDGSAGDSELPDGGTDGSTDGELPDDDTDGSTEDSELPDENNGDTGSTGTTGGGGTSNIITKTTVNPDGSITVTVTNLFTGTVTETTKNVDGSTTVVETKKNGTVTTNITDTSGNKTTIVRNSDGANKTTVANKDGASSVTTVGENGRTESVVKLPASVIEAAAKEGDAVLLPIPVVLAITDQENAPTVMVDLSGRNAKVEIPVRSVTPGTIVIRVNSDGTEEIVKTAVPAENGVTVTLSDGDIVKIMDNRKTFADVPDTYWGADAVAFTTSRELFDGISSTTFEPETSMTRAMILTVLARLEGVDTSTGETWYDAGRNWAMENDISDGRNLGQLITREQLATMLWRYAGEPMVTADLSSYTDASSVSAYAQQAMAWAIHDGIITGYTATTLYPQGEATRAQVATILMRFVNNIAAA